MGRGSSKASGANINTRLSVLEKKKITDGIKTHTKEQNDRAENSYLESIGKERNIIENFNSYVKIGYIKSKSDSWWIGHEITYNNLKAKYDFFKKERKRLKR